LDHYRWAHRIWVLKWGLSDLAEIDREGGVEVAEEPRSVRGEYRRPSLMLLPFWIVVDRGMSRAD
jgi:hypothetical protein